MENPNGGNGKRRDNLDAAQAIVVAIETDDVTTHEGLHVAHVRALIDIARSLRCIEGYLCNNPGRAAI